MGTYTWTGANGADWSVAGDWLPAGGPPGIADFAMVLSGGTVSVGEAESIDVLSLGAGAQLLLSAAPFTVAGSIDNGGLILVDGTLVVAGAVVSLTGNGTLALSGMNDSSVISALSAGDELVNAGAIAGTGTIGGGGLALTNEAGGVIDATSLDATAATLTVGSAGVSMANAGLVEATTAALVLRSEIANSGTVAATGGTVTVLGASISGGTLVASGGGLIVINGGTLDGSGAPVVNAGTIDAGVSGVWTDVLGTIENQGSIGGAETGNIIGFYNAGANLMLSGTVVLNGGGTIIGDAIAGGSTAVLVNADNTISGSTFDTLAGTPSPSTFLVTLDVGITNEAAGVIDYGAFGSLGVSNDGTIVNSDFTGVVDQTGGGTITSDATVEFGTTFENVSVIGQSATVEGGTLAGLLSILGTASLDGSVAPVENAGVITLGTEEGGVRDISAVATLLGGIDNAGTVLLASLPVDPPLPGFTSRIVVASPTVSLTGGGQIELSSLSAIGAAATGDMLANVDNTITGSGVIGGDGLVLDNQAGGLIEAMYGALTLDPLSMTNAGTVEATTGPIFIATPDLTNTGVMEANGETLTVTTGTITDLTGSWIADDSTIALPAPNGIAGVEGYLVLEGSAAEFVSSTGTNIPSLTNSYLAPQTIRAGGAIAVFDGATFGLAITPTDTVVVDGKTIITGGTLQPFGNAGLLELAVGTVDLDAIVTNTGLISGYGSLTIAGAVMNNAGGTVAANGGLLVFQGALTGGQLAIDVGASLELSSNWFGGGGAIPATFAPGRDLLQIDVADDAGNFSNVGSVAVNGFAYGNTIVVHGSVVGGGVFPGFQSVTDDGNALAFIQGGQTLGTLGFSGGTSQLVQSTDANNDVIITVACFAAGTRILTVAGETPVEALCVGDRLPTLLGGGVGTVRWIGHRDIDCRGHTRPEEVWPIRVRAGAFAGGVPRRDLWLSPDHAVYVENALVPVRYLVNGASIAQLETEAVRYWHLELDRHDVILAEGLAAETYLDTGNRAAFARRLQIDNTPRGKSAVACG